MGNSFLLPLLLVVGAVHLIILALFELLVQLFDNRLFGLQLSLHLSDIALRQLERFSFLLLLHQMIFRLLGHLEALLFILCLQVADFGFVFLPQLFQLCQLLL